MFPAPNEKAVLCRLRGNRGGELRGTQPWIAGRARRRNLFYLFFKGRLSEQISYENLFGQKFPEVFENVLLGRFVRRIDQGHPGRKKRGAPRILRKNDRK